MTTFALRRADCDHVALSGSLKRTKSSRPLGLLSAVLERLMTWQSRAEMRTHLSTLDDRLLSDAGVARKDAAAEAAKPFWKA